MHMLPELLALPYTPTIKSAMNIKLIRNISILEAITLFASNCIQVDNAEYARKGSKADPDLLGSDKQDNDYKNGTLLRHEVLGKKFTISSLNANFVKKTGWS